MKQRTLDWRQRRSWLGALRFYAGDVLRQDVRAHLERERPKCWPDDLAWLPSYQDILPVFCDRLTGYYTHVRAFHGCRPESIRSYYEHGLQGQQIDRIYARFRELYRDVAPVQVQEAIDSLQARSTVQKGKIWLTGDDKEMLNDYGHYSISGSEYLMSLAASLPGVDQWGVDYRWRLREIGIPTIFEVDIPFTLVEEAQREALAKMVLSAWGQNVTGRQLGRDSSPCYVIYHDIPAICIRGHYHPERIRDAHRSGKYVSKETTCEMCAYPSATSIT